MKKAIEQLLVTSTNDVIPIFENLKKRGSSFHFSVFVTRDRAYTLNMTDEFPIDMDLSLLDYSADGMGLSPELLPQGSDAFMDLSKKEVLTSAMPPGFTPASPEPHKEQASRRPGTFTWDSPPHTPMHTSPLLPAVQQPSPTAPLTSGFELPGAVEPEYGFALNNYAYPRGMDKSAATHHRMSDKTFYNIPKHLEPVLVKRILLNHIRGQPETLCEHPDKVCRFYMDYDCDYKMEEVLSHCQTVLSNNFPDSYLDGIRRTPMSELYRAWNVMCKEIDPLLVVVLRCPHPESGFRYHFVWPWFMLGVPQRLKMLTQMRQNISSYLPLFDSSKLEVPQFLRAPFCDKGEGTGSPRCYTLYGVYDHRGKRMPPFPDMNKTYPFPSPTDEEPDSLLRRMAAVWAMTSLRWPLLIPTADPHTPEWSQPPVAAPVPPMPRPPEPQREQEPEPEAPYKSPTATEWFRDDSIYVPKELQWVMDEVGPDAPNKTKKYAVVTYINGCAALCKFGEVCVAIKERCQNGTRISLISKNNARLLFSSPEIKLVKKEKTRKVLPFDIWIASINRRELDRIVFDPRISEEDLLPTVANSWRGFPWSAEECKAASEIACCKFNLNDFMDHLLNVVCGQDFHSFNYLVNWLCYVTQNPGSEVGTAIISAGDEGAGKSLPFAAIGKIFGQAYLRTSNVDDVAGRFNGSILGKCFIQLDELDYLDKTQNAALKALITDEEKRAESKYHMPISYNSHVAMVMTTNRPDKKLMKVNAAARRWCMLQAKRWEICDAQYFKDMAEYLYEKDFLGIKQIQYFLQQKLSVENWNPRVVPATKMLLEHKMANMKSEHMFLWECLSYGSIRCNGNNRLRVAPVCSDSVEWTEDGCKIAEYQLHDSFRDWCVHLKKRVSNINRFYQRLGDLFPVHREEESGFLFMVFDERNPHDPPQARRPTRTTYVILPPANQAREMFCKVYKDMDKVAEYNRIRCEPMNWVHWRTLLPEEAEYHTNLNEHYFTRRSFTA